MREGARTVGRGERVRWIGVVAVVVGASGCVRTGAVGRYAKAAGATAAEFPKLAEEMSASCARLEGYREARGGGGGGGGGGGSAGWFTSEDVEGRCAERGKAVRRAVAVERVLTSYFSALGGLAGAKVVNYDRSVDKLAGTLVIRSK